MRRWDVIWMDCPRGSKAAPVAVAVDRRHVSITHFGQLRPTSFRHGRLIFHLILPVLSNEKRLLERNEWNIFFVILTPIEIVNVNETIINERDGNYVPPWMSFRIQLMQFYISLTLSQLCWVVQILHQIHVDEITIPFIWENWFIF